MATIIAILVAVLLDRYGQYMPGGQVLSKMRSTAWLNSYCAKYAAWLEKMSINQSYLVVLSLFVPLCILLFVFKLIFVLLLGKTGAFLFTILALWYFLGNRDIDPNASEYVAMHETSFGVLFWFSILGSTGGLLYWFLAVSKQSEAVIKLHALAAWIPARITAFIYALVGNFTPGFQQWVACMRAPNKSSSQVLEECGTAAVDLNIAGDDKRLVQRAFAAWVVLSIFYIFI